MKITLEEQQRLEDIYQSFLHNEKILKMKEFNMHRGSNCYEHSFKVAKKAIRYAIRSRRKNINFEFILLGAILHDYYLYDWRKDRSQLKGHTKNHPKIALNNAIKDFGINKEVEHIIKSHMWPLNTKDYPTSREAKLVSISDKVVSLCESLTSISYKNKHRDKYLTYISILF